MTTVRPPWLIPGRADPEASKAPLRVTGRRTGALQAPVQDIMRWEYPPSPQGFSGNCSVIDLDAFQAIAGHSEPGSPHSGR